MTLAATVMLVSAFAFRNALLPMLVTPSGMVIDVSEGSPWKAELPMLVTLAGIK